MKYQFGSSGRKKRKKNGTETNAAPIIEPQNEVKTFEETDRELIQKLEPIMDLLANPELKSYLETLLNRRKRMVQNFIFGMAKGFGMAIGFTVLGAVTILILQYVVKLNLPFIGGFIADIVLLVQSNLRK